MSSDRRIDLGEWQRLSAWALPLLLVNGVQRFVRENLWLFVGAGAGAAFTERLGLRELVLGGLILLLFAALFGLIYYRRLRFRLEADAVVVRKGLIHREETRLRFDRVQSIELRQPFYLRPFDVVRFALESPGGHQTEVELPGIARDLAEAMRERIAAERRTAAATVEPGAGPEPAESRPRSEPARPATEVELFAASPGNLFLFGVANNQIWVALGVLAAPLADQIERWVGRRVEALVEALDPAEAELAGQLSSAPIWVIALIAGLLLALICTGLLVSGLIAWVRYHGFRLVRIDARIQARFGLLERRERNLSVPKLTSLELVQTGIGRLLGRWYLIGHQTGSAMHEGVGKRQRFLVPGLDSHTAQALAGRMLPGAEIMPAFEPVSPALRQSLWLRWTAALMSVVAVLQFIVHAPAGLLTGLVTANLVLLGLIQLRWRRWGWVHRHGRLQIRSGLIGQRIACFEARRVQFCALSRNPVQRRLGLASVRFRLPHGDHVVPWIEFARARELVNQVVFELETARPPAWQAGVC